MSWSSELGQSALRLHLTLPVAAFPAASLTRHQPIPLGHEAAALTDAPRKSLKLWVSSNRSPLSLTYRGSPLAHDLDDTTEIRAGDRAPDAPCVRATSSETVRLFDVFQGTHFTLLAFGARPAPRLPDRYTKDVRTHIITRLGTTTAVDADTLVDSDGHAHRAYGIRDEAMILVRPDGYIGLTGGSFDQESLIGYLHKLTGQ